MMITGVLLAAGTSSRMDFENKLLLPLGHQTMIERVLSNMIAAGLDDLIVVTGHDSENVRKVLGEHLRPGIKIIENKLFAEGRASSIRCAVASLDKNCDALLFMVADKPKITTALINLAIDLFKSKRPDVLAVKTPQGRGHPVVFSKKIFSELEALQGDRVGEELLAKHADDVLWLSDSEAQPNINTRQDYDHLLHTMKLDSP